MFSVFPSDFTAYHDSSQLEDIASQEPRGPVSSRGTFPSGTISAYRQRTANGAFHYEGEALPYPASLPTSGVNPQIIEFRRGPATAQQSSTASVPVSHPNISSPSISREDNLVTATQPSVAAPPSASRELIVPILEVWEGDPSTVFNKPVIERVAFRFAQDPVSAPLLDDICREVLLKDKRAFDEWMKQQLSLQNWRKKEDVDLPKKAKEERERYAKAKRERMQEQRAHGGEGEGIIQTQTRAYKRKKPGSGKLNRIVYTCDHAGKPEPKKGKGKKLVTKPSIKARCEARLVAYLLEDESVRVQVEGRHTNHDLRTEDSMTESRMPLAVREWIDARVEEGMTAQGIYNHVALGEAEMEGYESPDSEESSDEEMSQDEADITDVVQPMLYNFKVNIDYIRARIRWYNATKRRPTNLNGHDLADVEACGALLSEIQVNGGWSLSCLGQSPDGPVDVIAFATKWQIKILKKYGGTVMMDATHNVTKGLNGNKAYLYTLIVKNKKTNRGTPVAFLMTESASQYPIEIFLRKLFSDDKAPCGQKPHTFIIDCSRTEQAAINCALPNTRVLYCHYHFWKAINAQLDKKVGKGATSSAVRAQRESARSLIRRMVRSDTEETFNEAWNTAQREWTSQGPKWKTFLDYFIRQWHYQAEEWAGYSRKYEHGGIDTNNYLESWHQKLKTNYIKKRNMNMPAVIALLIREILPLFRFAHLRIARGFADATLTTAEQRNRKRPMEYPEADVMSSIEIFEAAGKIRIRSSQDPRAHYHITFKAKRGTVQPVTCTCLSFQQTHDRCKHMFLVVRYTMALPVPFLNGSNSGAEDDGVDSGNRVVEDLRDVIVGGVDTGGAHGKSTPAVPSHTPMMLTAMPRGNDNVMGPEDRLPDVSDDDDEPDLNPPALRLPSSSPPPLHVTQREKDHYEEGRAIQETSNDLAETLYRNSVNKKLGERHNQERMRNMVAQLQAMLSRWPEAIGMREPGAAQKR